MSLIDKNTICAVMVTFYPSHAELHNSVQATWSQVGQVIVVDNTPVIADEKVVSSYATLPIEKLFLGENKGVASAQNRGIEWAKRHGFSHVLLLDQDSVPARDMIKKLCFALEGLQKKGRQVAAVGPMLYDERDDKQVHFVVRRHNLMRRYFCSGDEVVLVEHLISSGSLLPLDSLDEIGLLEESLFIEYVDVEWCLRAQHRGYCCYGVAGAILNHKLGDTTITSPLLLERRFQTYAPFRYYYQFRNAISLCRRRYIPLCVSLHIFVVHIVCRFLLSMIILPSRMATIKMMAKGIWHGIIGKSGPLPPDPDYAGHLHKLHK